jgi:anti-sigma regulatory factor (Ser/Thr protein kinase)
MKRSGARDTVSLRFRSEPRLLCVARAAVRRHAELAGLPERRVEAVVLAVDEGLTNVIRHCYGGRTDEPIELDLALEGADPAELVIRIRDFGPGVSEDCLRPPAEKDPHCPGGLGLRLIHEVMDSVRLERPPEGGNALILRLACRSEDGGPR